MVAGADVLVDAEADFDHPLAALELLRVSGPQPALAGKLAFAVGDDHFEAAFGGAHRRFQSLRHLADAVAAHGAHPSHAERAQRLFDAHAGRRAAAIGGARRQKLLAGGGGVAILHHDQHAVALVEQVRSDAGDHAVVPETAVTHHRDRAALHIGRDRGCARQRHAVAEDRVAEAERRKRRERMAADVGADVRGAELALHQLDGAEHWPLRAAGTEVRRPWRNVAERDHGGRFMREHSLRACCGRIGVDACWSGLLEERGKAVDEHVRGVFPGARQHALAEHARRHVGAAQLHIDHLLDIVGGAFLDHEHRALSGAELAQLLRHERKGDIEHVNRNAARAVEVAEVQPLERAQHAVG